MFNLKPDNLSSIIICQIKRLESMYLIIISLYTYQSYLTGLDYKCLIFSQHNKLSAWSNKNIPNGEFPLLLCLFTQIFNMCIFPSILCFLPLPSCVIRTLFHLMFHLTSWPFSLQYETWNSFELSFQHSLCWQSSCCPVISAVLLKGRNVLGSCLHVRKISGKSLK